MCCKNLRHVSLPEKLEYIGKQCFQESAVESVILPDPLQIIEDSTFRDCENLKHVEFSECLEKVQHFAFYGTGLENVKLPASLREIV